MIASAEMGVSVGDTDYLTSIIRRQVIYVLIGFAFYAFLSRVNALKFPTILYLIGYFGLLGLLIICRFFPPVGGAYAWIWLPGGASIQPSEFAKVFMIAFAARLFSKDRGEDNRTIFWIYAGMAFLYFIVIALVQHDFGSAMVLAIVSYCVVLLPDLKELRKYQIRMRILILIAIAGAVLLLSDPVTELLKKYSDHYMIGRFLAAADPFLYQYDNGYHLIMSLVSFANGGLFGLGYGNSIHKYMNFPNPSNDFILPVIVEELGIAGFIFLITLYGILFFSLISASLKSKLIRAKMVYLGVFTYFAVHFIFNIGGVSGLIPLTGVPLLMISSGGSSLVASLAALGLVQSQIIHDRELQDEDNSRQIQADADQDTGRI